MEKEPRFAGKFVILMIGRLSEEKRQDVLMKAVARSAHAGDIQLILAGQGPRRRALEQLGAAPATIVDNLVYTYTGNQLTALTENAAPVSGDIYMRGNTAAGSYTYDTAL